jgi:hypothetical protein
MMDKSLTFALFGIVMAMAEGVKKEAVLWPFPTSSRRNQTGTSTLLYMGSAADQG